MIFYNKFSNSRSKCKLGTYLKSFAFMIDFEINYIHHDMTRRSNGQIPALCLKCEKDCL